MSKYGTFAFIFFTLISIDLSGQLDSLINAFKDASTPEVSAAIVNKMTEKCGVDFECIRPFYVALHELKADDRILNTYYSLGNYYFRKGFNL